MTPRTCLVTLTDARRIKHSVEVTAESLFEAGLLAVSAFREAGWRKFPASAPGWRSEGAGACGEAHHLHDAVLLTAGLCTGPVIARAAPFPGTVAVAVQVDPNQYERSSHGVRIDTEL